MQIAAALDYLTSSLAALRSYYRSLDSGFPLNVEVRSFRLAAKKQQLQLWWVNTHKRKIQEFLWDFCECEGPTGAGDGPLARELKRLGLPYNPDGIAARDIAPPTPGPAFAYHPFRIRGYHPSAASMAEFAGERTGIKQSVFTKVGFGAATSAIQAAMQRRSSPLRDQVELPNERELLGDMPLLALMYAEFQRRESVVFDLPNELVVRFRETAPAKVSFGSVYLPEPSFYVRFRPQRDLSWRAGWCVDGAYVARVAQDYWQFVITCAPTKPEMYVRAARSVEPVYAESWRQEDYDKPAGSAVDRVVSSRISELKELIKPLAAPKRASRIPGLVSQLAMQELAALPRRRAAWTQSLNLLINSLLYLSGYQDDAENVSLAQSLGYSIHPAADASSSARARARAQELRLNLAAADRRADRQVKEAPGYRRTRRPPRTRHAKAK